MAFDRFCAAKIRNFPRFFLQNAMIYLRALPQNDAPMPIMRAGGAGAARSRRFCRLIHGKLA